MKTHFKKLTALAFMMCSTIFFGQNKVEGYILDENNKAIEGANVYLENTVYGASSDQNGKFHFEYSIATQTNLIVEILDYEKYVNPFDPNLKSISIVLKKKENVLDEVVIKASNFSLGKSRTVEKMNSLDVVMTGSSNGDIFGALQSLPGSQKVGEDGKLYVRGGDSRETQTFIDGMHVLIPYTSNSPDTPSRGKFSPFLFQGINLSLGGYETEYGQALSAVLPMDTKNVAAETKFGINFSPLSLGGGGTIAGKQSSFSFNTNLTDLRFFNSIFPDEFNWKKEYQNFTSEGQYKYAFKNNDVFKIYWGYDHTEFSREIVDNLNNNPNRFFTLNENNLYVNTTYLTKTRKGTQFFAGTSFSKLRRNYYGAEIADDLYNENEQEVHIKLKVKKSVSKFYKFSGGLESYLKEYKNDYYIDNQASLLQEQKINYGLYASFFDNQFKLKKGFYSNLSGRIEYDDYDKNTVFSPRVSCNYVSKEFQLSVIYGKYFQMVKNTIMLANNTTLNQERANHYIVSTSYDKGGRSLKLEFYYKKYDNLALEVNNEYFSDGYGKSTGFDLYYSDNSSIKNTKFSVSYSFNDSQRKYLNFPQEAVPTFASKNNIRVNMLYYFKPIKTFFGLTNSYSSGRPYENPNLSGYNNSRTKEFNSLDINASILLSKKVILYTSLSNVLGRQNVFTYRYSSNPDTSGVYNGEPLMAARDRFFFIGLFISLKNNSAYDVSNF